MNFISIEPLLRAVSIQVKNISLWGVPLSRSIYNTSLFLAKTHILVFVSSKSVKNYSRTLKNTANTAIDRGKSKELLELPRNRISITVGALTGHCLIGAHARRFNAPAFDFCRCCLDEEEEESPQHLLLHCPALARLRLKHLGSYFFNSLSELACVSPTSVSNFIRSTKWFER